MKYLILIFSILSIQQLCSAQISIEEQLVQQQLDAYNARDIDAFLEPYADSVKVYTYPDKLNFTGKTIMREIYSGMFKQLPDLHCNLLNRIVNGNTVIDHEKVLYQKEKPTTKAIAIYKIENDKIIEVRFVQ